MFTNWLIPLIVALSGDRACAAPACTCAPPRFAEVAAAEATAVFIGTPIGVRSGAVRYEDAVRWPVKVYTFRVQSSWKGVEDNTIQVVTGLGNGDCGIRFRLNTEYLVYAHESDGGGPGMLATSLCSRTAPRAEAAADIRILGTPERNSP